MTSTEDCHSRICNSSVTPQGPSVPQPVFINQANIPQGAGWDAPPLRGPVPSSEPEQVFTNQPDIPQGAGWNAPPLRGPVPPIMGGYAGLAP